MPHLSPLKWKLMSITALIFLLSLASSLWWTQLPTSHIPQPTAHIPPSNKWPWPSPTSKY